ncbi:MAG TPA: acyltransferase [Puia sp.]|nr:acyltransferase [Puia sp.]
MPMRLPDTEPDRIPALDGLRGAAILMVIFWHYSGPSGNWFPGWQGVDLFFVLSGYLITGRLAGTKGLPGYFSRFYRNRALRILPLYYAVVAFYMVMVHFFVRTIHYPAMSLYFTHWKSFFLFTENWTFISSGVPRDISLVPLWSVAVEAHFYLLWPLLVLLTTPASRLKILPALIAVVLVGRAIAASLYPQPFETIYFNSFFRLDCFCAGALVYDMHACKVQIPIKWVKAAALLLAGVEIAGLLAARSASPGSFFSFGGYTVSALLFACLLHMTAQGRRGILVRILRQPSLRFCGKISYCLYLVHIPILLNIGPRFNFLWPVSWSLNKAYLPWPSVVICLAMSFTVSVISYRYFESFFLRLKRARPQP